MKIAGSATVPAPRERVFKMLLDPAVLQRIIPGCEQIVVIDNKSFRIAMSAGLATIRGKVEGTIQVEEERSPEHYRLAMSGKGMGSFVNGWAAIDLAESGDETAITYSGEANVGGMIAAVGNRMIDLAVKKALSDFFEKLKQEAAA